MLHKLRVMVFAELLKKQIDVMRQEFERIKMRSEWERVNERMCIRCGN